jgi:hypothetical protein
MGATFRIYYEKEGTARVNAHADDDEDKDEMRTWMERQGYACLYPLSGLMFCCELLGGSSTQKEKEK